MAKIVIKLDKRNTKLGEYPIRICVSATDSSAYLQTVMYVEERYWIGDVRGAYLFSPQMPNYRYENNKVMELYYYYSQKLSELERRGLTKRCNAQQVKDMILHDNIVAVSENRVSDLFLFTEKYIAKIDKENTRQKYKNTLMRLREYIHTDAFDIININYKWLTDFDEWLVKKCKNSVNTRSIHMRNIRTIYNRAIDEELVPLQSYPFRKFKIKSALKEKEYLPIDGFKKLLALDNLTLKEERARDLFMLSFYMCGINFADLWEMPKNNGRIKFIRKKIEYKSPLPVHMTIQPEAQAIIDKYAGNTHMLRFCEGFSCQKTFINSVHFGLGKISEMIGYKITYYWARYSWATIAAKLDIPSTTISKALGHTDQTTAEKHYISFDWEKVDNANRKVIDYLTAQIKL